VTIGQYVAICDTASISPTFMQAQFEEAMMLLEKLGPAGAQLMPAVIDLIIGMSSMPRKQEWIERINAALGKPTAPQPGAAGTWRASGAAASGRWWCTDAGERRAVQRCNDAEVSDGSPAHRQRRS
jgi:hypothetical protein